MNDLVGLAHPRVVLRRMGRSVVSNVADAKEKEVSEEHKDVRCPKCEADEWDYVEYERGMEDGDKPFFRCNHCWHEWKKQ